MQVGNLQLPSKKFIFLDVELVMIDNDTNIQNLNQPRLFYFTPIYVCIRLRKGKKGGKQRNNKKWEDLIKTAVNTGNNTEKPRKQENQG